MDSVTQIVLGAAVGEATLGRKVGNRAMLWGGILGTLPDLDVLANAVTDPMSALVYHRAFTHSLPFAVLAAPLLGLAIHRLYGGREGPVRGAVFWAGALVLFWALLATGSYLMPVEVYRIPEITGLITLVFAGIFGLVAGLRALRGYPRETTNAAWRDWTLLAFLCVVTHPILDCFTAYGTQFFQPFAKNRLAWNTISVADPLYTLPFLVLLVWARTRVPSSDKRAKLNRAGLVISSVYLALTVVNYFNVGHVLDRSLAAADIQAAETVHSPSILNNVLWSATARAESDVYYFSQYSLFDAERRFQPFTRIEGNHAWLAPYAADRDLRILAWFTKGFYGVLPTDTTAEVQVNDLRYGLIGPDPADPANYIFSWRLDTTVHPVRVTKEQAGPREDLDPAEWLAGLWERVKGV